MMLLRTVLGVVLACAAGCSALSTTELGFDTLSNVRLQHEDSHIPLGRRVKRTLNGSPQPFPDTINLSFTALNEEWSYSDIPLMTDHIGHQMHLHLESPDGSVQKFPVSYRNYVKNFDNGDWVSITLQDDEGFRAILQKDGHEYYLGLHEDMSGEPQLKTEAALEARKEIAPAAMIALKVDSAQSHFDCKTAEAQGLNADPNTPLVGEATLTIHDADDLHHSQHSRSLLQDTFRGDVFDNCFVGFASNNVEITIHLIAGHQVFAKYGARTEAYMTEIIASVNAVTRPQLHLSMKVTRFTVYDSACSGSGRECFDNCNLDISDTLDGVRALHEQNFRGGFQVGTTHFLDACRDYGTVGLAYVSAICNTYAAGTNSALSNSHYKTFIHELGHNLGGGHSFEDGQGRTGGIMDYGDGTLNGINQFNIKYRKDGMCRTINTASTGQCAQLISIGGCGNGIKDAGEECDIDSPCCDQSTCKFTQGSTCISELDGECCEECNISDSCGWCTWTNVGADYEGYQSTTVNGFTCAAWDAQTPHRHNFGYVGSHNYCRNPDEVIDSTFCFTTDPDQQYDYCDIGTPQLPKCGGAEGTGDITPSPTKAPTPAPAVQCPELLPPANANGPRCAGKGVGETCTFKCDSGFSATNSQGTRTCSTNSEGEPIWAGEPINCKQDACPDLSAPDNASGSDCTGQAEGSRCTFTCDKGYQSNGFDSRSCSSGEWTGRPLVCTAKVCETLAVPNGADGETCFGYTEGEKCTFACKGDTFTSSGSPTRTCTDGAFDGTYYACTEKSSCPQLYSPRGAIEASCVGKKLDDTCTFECDVGYVAAVQPSEDYPNPETRTCISTSNGNDVEWSVVLDDSGNEVEFQCIAQVCPYLKSPRNAAEAECRNKFQDDTCTFACNTGYEGNAYGTRTCKSGQWTGEDYLCSPKTCKELSPPDNADGAACKNSLQGQTCTFTCKEGFSTTGDATRTCDNEEWSGFALVCSDESVQYVYTAGSWGECSAECDETQGRSPPSQTREVYCVDVKDGNKVVENSFCEATGTHDIIQDQPCNTQNCVTYSWTPSKSATDTELGWDECSTTCGGGQQFRELSCLANEAGSDNVAFVSNEYCDEANKPITVRACGQEPCDEGESRWVSGIWTPCDVECGAGGTQSRQVTCLDFIGNTLPPTDPTCPEEQPVAERPCNTEECGGDVYTWETCPFEECTAECGGAGTVGGLMSGTLNRQVFCVDNNGKRVASTACANVGAEPTSVIVGCNPQPCSDFNWMTTPWSLCQAGQRFRTVHCHGPDGSNANNDDCDERTRPQTEDLACQDGVCPAGGSTDSGDSTGDDIDTSAGGLSGVSSVVPSVIASTVVGAIAFIARA